MFSRLDKANGVTDWRMNGVNEYFRNTIYQTLYRNYFASWNPTKMSANTNSSLISLLLAVISSFPLTAPYSGQPWFFFSTCPASITTFIRLEFLHPDAVSIFSSSSCCGVHTSLITIHNSSLHSLHGFICFCAILISVFFLFFVTSDIWLWWTYCSDNAILNADVTHFS